MATRHPRARLRHIQDEIEALQVAFDGVTFETFLKSYVLRRTAEHAVLIISEAVKSLHDDLLAHWRVVTDRLPELSRVIATMTDDLDR